MSTNFLNINPSNQHYSGNLFVTGITSTTDVDNENNRWSSLTLPLAIVVNCKILQETDMDVFSLVPGSCGKVT
jgi:hypothetical protein